MRPESHKRSPASGHGADPALVRRHLELLLAVRRIMQAFDLHSRRLSGASQVTLPQLLCLMAVTAEEGMTSRQIARRTHASASTLVGVLDRLEAKKLVSRVRDARDRRKIHIAPTAAGRELVASAPSPFGDAFDEEFASLSPSRQKRLVDDLALMAELMSGQDESPREKGG